MMPKSSRKRGASDEYDSDGGFVEDAPKSKKTKSSDDGNSKELSLKMDKDDDGNEYWEISGKRRLTVSEFKGMTMVSLREYYPDKGTGKMRPGNKGIALTAEQFTAIVELLPQVESVLKSKGIEVPRPEYDSKTGGKDSVEPLVEPEEQEAGKSMENPPKSKSKLEKFRLKANHEATSDEDED